MRRHTSNTRAAALVLGAPRTLLHVPSVRWAISVGSTFRRVIPHQFQSDGHVHVTVSAYSCTGWRFVARHWSLLETYLVWPPRCTGAADAGAACCCGVPGCAPHPDPLLLTVAVTVWLKWFLTVLVLHCQFCAANCPDSRTAALPLSRPGMLRS